MASVITATNSSGLTTSADNSGVLQLASGTGNLVTVPSVTGTAMVSGNMPAFSANYTGSTQSISSATWTKVTFNAEAFDTNNNFSSSTFTPTVAGYYQLNASVYQSGFGGSFITLHLYKNAGDWQELMRTTASGQGSLTGSALVYANGTTDSFSIYIYSAGSTCTVGAGSFEYVNFSGSMVRAA